MQFDKKGLTAPNEAHFKVFRLTSISVSLTTFSVASLVSAGVDLRHEGTTLPMLGAVLACIAAGRLVSFAASRSGQ
jgi:hypothetical protein